MGGALVASPPNPEERHLFLYRAEFNVMILVHQSWVSNAMPGRFNHQRTAGKGKTPAIVIAGNGIAFAKEKKVVVSDAADLCSTKHSAKKPVPELDCSSTGTAKLPAGATPEKPHLG